MRRTLLPTHPILAVASGVQRSSGTQPGVQASLAAAALRAARPAAVFGAARPAAEGAR